jgi:hypothetical protein
MPKGIYKTVVATTAQGGQPVRERVADFSYQNESLAQLIVFAWADQNFRNQLLSSPSAAKQALADRGIYLKAPFVIRPVQQRL